MKVNQIRTRTLFICMLALLFSSFWIVAQAADVYVKTTGSNVTGNGSLANPYQTISYAISQALPGDVIHIGAGQFEEQIEVSKELTLIGEGSNQTKILSPALLTPSFSTSAPTSAIYFAVVYVHDVNNAVIKNLTVDGNNNGDMNTAFLGIAYRNAGGLVDGCQIISVINDPPYTSEFGYGLFALADNGVNRTLTVSNSNFIIFQKNATGFLGQDLTAIVDNNTITGAGPRNEIAQNGVQFSYRATGTVSNNKIKSLLYNGVDRTATGILVLNTRTPVVISGNEINDCQTAIYCIDGGATVSQNKVVFNPLNMGAADYWWGIMVRNGTFIIKENELDGGGNGLAIDGSAFANQTTITTVTNNIVKNFETGIGNEEDGDPGCSYGEVHYNSITNTTYPLYNNQLYANDPNCPKTDYDCNWYGSANENDFKDKFDGGGDIEYTPWLTNGTDQQPGTIGFQPDPNACNGGVCRDLNTKVVKETFPYQFNTSFAKSLYNKTFVGSSGTWTVNSDENATMVVTTPYYSPSTSYALKVVNFKTYYCGSSWSKAVSPKLDLSGPCCPEGVKLNFTLWTYNVVNGDTKARLKIDFSNDNGTTWVEAWSKTSNDLYDTYGANGKTTINISVPISYQTANFRYRIRGEMEAGDYNNFYVFIDDIHFTSPAVCTPLGSIGDYVWKDLNSNGKQDAGEPGIPGVTVKLTLPDLTVVTKTTDATGKYLFTGLTAGNYVVTFVTPAGYIPTLSNQGVDDAIDSDPVNGSVAVTLTTGENNLTVDAGFKAQVCTNTTNHTETFPNKFNTYFTTSLYNKTFVGSSGTWTTNSNSRGTMVVTTPYYSPSTSYALKVVNYNTNGCGAGWTKAVSPKVDLSNPCCPSELKMNFTLWTYKVVNGDIKAKLEVDFSKDNGVTWTEVWSKTSDQLYDSYGSNGKTNINIAVPLSYQNSNFRYRIRGEMASGDCNNFYVFIDDIKIGSPASCSTYSSYTARTTSTGTSQTYADETAKGKQPVETVEELKIDFEVNVFPNPTNGEFQLRLSSSEIVPATVKVVDMLGRTVKSMRISSNQSVSFGSDLRSGSYVVEVTQGESKKVVKLVKL